MYFPVTDKAVRVSCNDPKAIPFDIHESLLKDNARWLQIVYHESGQPTAKVHTSHDALKFFAQWLYHGTTLKEVMCEFEDGFTHEELIAVLDAHALGETVGCFDFMDMILDGIIDNLPESIMACAKLMIKAFANKFVLHSGRAKLAIDILLHTSVRECDYDCADHHGLDHVDDRPFVTELAQRILALKGYNIPEDITKSDYCEMVIIGFLEANRRKDDYGTEDPPWLQNRCQYHRHKELKLQCYRDKPKPVQRVSAPWPAPPRAGKRKRMLMGSLEDELEEDEFELSQRRRRCQSQESN